MHADYYSAVLDKLDWFLQNMTDYDYAGAENDYNLVYELVNEDAYIEFDEMCDLFDSLISHYTSKNPHMNDFIDAVENWKDKTETYQELNDTYYSECFPYKSFN